MAFTILKQASIPNPAGAVTQVENLGSPKARWNINAGRSYTVKLKVQTNSQYVGAIQVIQSISPVRGAYYRWPLTEVGGGGSLPTLPVEQDTGSFLQEVNCDPDGDDGRQWILTLEYTPYDIAHEVGDDNGTGAIDPTVKPPEVSWSSAKYERSKPEDESDPPQPYINTVGDPLVDPPKTEESRPLLTITRNEPTYNETWLNSFIDHVNSDTFLGYPPNTVKCKDINAKRVYEADWGYFWEVTYEFEFREDPDGRGWDEPIVNAGFREKKNGTGNPVAVMVSDAPVSEPVLLQANGAYTPGADPVYIVFKLFRPVSFASLGIAEDILTTSV